MSFEEKYGIKGLTMVAVILGVFMAILDTSVVNVALPKMIAVFATNQDTIEWVITGYMLVVGMLTPVSGYIGDRFGYKKVFQIALIVFTVGSALCGASGSIGMLIFFRVIQAIGGTLLMTISMSLLFRMSKPENRGMVMGLWGIAMMFAPAFGPVISGYFVQYLDWRLIFYINVPIGIIDAMLVQATVPDLPAMRWTSLIYRDLSHPCLVFLVYSMLFRKLRP